MVSGCRQIQVTKLIESCIPQYLDFSETINSTLKYPYINLWEGTFTTPDVFNPEEEVVIDHPKFIGIVYISSKKIDNFYHFKGNGELKWKAS